MIGTWRAERMTAPGHAPRVAGAAGNWAPYGAAPRAAVTTSARRSDGDVLPALPAAARDRLVSAHRRRRVRRREADVRMGRRCGDGRGSACLAGRGDG